MTFGGDVGGEDIQHGHRRQGRSPPWGFALRLSFCPIIDVWLFEGDPNLNYLCFVFEWVAYPRDR